MRAQDTLRTQLWRKELPTHKNLFCARRKLLYEVLDHKLRRKYNILLEPLIQIDKELDLATEAYLEGDDALRIELADWEDEEEEAAKKKKKKKKEEEEERDEVQEGDKQVKANGVEEGTTKKVRIEDIETVKEDEEEEGEQKERENGEVKKETEEGTTDNEKKGGEGDEEEGEKKKSSNKSKDKDEYFPPRPVSTVHLSMLFKWYKADFGENKEEVLGWILERLNEKSEKKKQVEEILRRVEECRDEGQPVFKIKHIKYDWGHNDKDKKEKS